MTRSVPLVVLLALSAIAACKDESPRIRGDRASVTSGNAKAEAPARLDLSSLEGRWTSDVAHRTLAARLEKGTLAFRVASVAEFDSAYDEGELRFELAPSAVDGELLVIDHYRPSPGASASFSEVGKKACLTTFTAVDDGPLRARATPDGGLSVDFAGVTARLVPGSFADGGVVFDSCAKVLATHRLVVTLHRAK
jgi:hypothetical protein